LLSGLFVGGFMYSVVHHHLVAVINSEIETDKKSMNEISILDAGCGNCKTISLIYSKINELNPSIIVHIHGFDVNDSQVQEDSFFEKSINFLDKEIPGHKWAERLKLIESNDVWPYENDKFDFVISNQVLEHVFNKNHFFREMNRVLKVGGKGIHIFPLKHYIIEGHLLLPFVHRIKNRDYLNWYIKFFSRIGLGKYKKLRKNNPNLSLDDYANMHSDYMIHNTDYVTKSELFRLAKRYHFRSSFRYSGWMYINKFRSVFRMRLAYQYNFLKNIIISYFMEIFLLRLSSITLFLEKLNIYR
jgi:SAM-dependent methyltransferase